jgi:hypothetical protein
MNESLRIENLLKLLRRGSFELSGEEALIFAQSFEWLLEKKKQLAQVSVPALPEPTQAVAIVKEPPIKKPKGKK